MRQTMADKTVLITGATSGIGFIAARALAAMGAQVVIVGRDPAKAQASVERIQRETGGMKAYALSADLSSMEDVRRLAAEFQARYPRLDVLLNNAGAVFYSYQTTVDGYERTFALNHLAPFLLTNLLLDRLKSDAPARVVTVSSLAHVGQKLDFGDVNQTVRGYRAWRAYGESKLANVMFTYALARRLEGTGVTANTLHPGFVATNFARNNGPRWQAAMTLARPFAISPERGAQTSIYLASSPDVAGISGKYFIKEKPANSSNVAYDVNAQEQLWSLSERMTGLTSATSSRHTV
ncbi:MAG TPA: SDR family oxidoreductase [Ktedonobacterales bacterium]|nr:SDR family oxidoreductase [Ktedonobacterales bacterium]